MTWDLIIEVFFTRDTADQVVLDNGCTTVVTDRRFFRTFEFCTPQTLGTLSQDPNSNAHGAVEVLGRGTVLLQTEIDGCTSVWEIPGAMFVPKGRRNLISDP